jgi:hypothetical protein
MAFFQSQNESEGRTNSVEGLVAGPRVSEIHGIGNTTLADRRHCEKIKTPFPSHVKMIAALLARYSRVASDQEERYGEG